jgi:hypothetical protein
MGTSFPGVATPMAAFEFFHFGQVAGDRHEVGQ